MGQLKSSGFTWKQAKEIVVSGVVGWRRKLERREKAGQKEYLEVRETLDKMPSYWRRPTGTRGKRRGGWRTRTASSNTTHHQREGSKTNRKGKETQEEQNKRG